MRVSRGLARTPKSLLQNPLVCCLQGLRKFRTLSGSSAQPAEVPHMFGTSEHGPEVLDIWAITASFWEWGINTPSSTSLQLLLALTPTNSQPKDFKALLPQIQVIS